MFSGLKQKWQTANDAQKTLVFTLIFVIFPFLVYFAVQQIFNTLSATTLAVELNTVFKDGDPLVFYTDEEMAEKGFKYKDTQTLVKGELKQANGSKLVRLSHLQQVTGNPKILDKYSDPEEIKKRVWMFRQKVNKPEGEQWQEGAIAPTSLPLVESFAKGNYPSNNKVFEERAKDKRVIIWLTKDFAVLGNFKPNSERENYIDPQTNQTYIKISPMTLKGFEDFYMYFERYTSDEEQRQYGYPQIITVAINKNYVRAFKYEGDAMQFEGTLKKAP